MLKLKKGKMQVESLGSKKDLLQPTFEIGKVAENAKLFMELDNFK